MSFREFRGNSNQNKYVAVKKNVAELKFRFRKTFYILGVVYIT